MPAIDYDELACYYDALPTDQSDLPCFRDLARRANGPVAELMAGSGRLSVPLAEDGIDITCVDRRRLATVGPGKGGRWGFMDPRTKRELTLSLETTCDARTGIVRGEEALSFAESLPRSADSSPGSIAQESGITQDKSPPDLAFL